MGAASGNSMARQRVDLATIDQKKRLRTSGSVVESPLRPTVVVGQRLSRKSRLKAAQTTPVKRQRDY